MSIEQLQADRAILVVVDVQENAIREMCESDRVCREITRLVRSAKTLGVPVLLTEHAPATGNPTVSSVREALGDQYDPIEKHSFSAAGDLHFMQQFEVSGRQQILVCGAESHVCVWLTARDLHQLGWNVQVVGDAITSRNELDHRITLDRMMHHGIGVTTVEMAVYEMLGGDDNPFYQEISDIMASRG